MAQLQFLNGTRDAEVQDLPEEAGLTLGSQDGSYILVKDQAVEPKHATVYSVKGQFYVRPEGGNAKCFVNFRPLPAEGSAISDKDIVMFGRTLAKFWRATAPVGATGGGGGGSDPRVAKERDDLKAQVASLQQQMKQASSGASSAAQAQIDAAKREKDELAKKLEQSTTESRRALDDAKQETSKKAQEADKEKKAKEALEAEVEKAKKRADDAEAEAAKAKPELDKKEKEVEGLRKSLEAFQTAEARAKRDRLTALRSGSDLAQAVSALGLADALRERLTAALHDEVDREILSRGDGPVVALRGLRCPSCDSDLESELQGQRRRRQKVEALKALGVAGLSAEDAKALVEKARARS